MVRVVSRILNDHVLEQYEICSKDVIYPGLDLSSLPPHAPHAPILQPQLTPWEEVQYHVHYPCRHELVRNGLPLRCAFRLRQVGIEVAGHQYLGPVRSSPDVRSNILYVRGVAREDITPHNMPPPPRHHQPKYYDIWAMESELFNSEVLHLAVENCNSAAVSTRRLRCHHPKASRFPRVNSVSNFCLL